MNWVRVTWLFLYFRLGALPVLFHAIGWAGLFALLVRPNWANVGLCLVAILTAYCFTNERLFREASRTKQEVVAFLSRYRAARFERVRVSEFARWFDVSFLIPSYVRPDRLVRYFARSRLYIFTARSGESGPPLPSSPRAYVSPIAQDAYVFLRDEFANMPPEQHFRLAHELGHAAAMYCAMAQRNLIGAAAVYASIAWVAAVTVEWHWPLVAWTVLQLFATMMLGGMFARFREDEHFYGEIVADYMAVRHLSAEAARELLDTGLAARLVQTDPSLDEAQLAKRREILLDQLQRLGRGEAIDVPQIYLNYSFNHPIGLLLFVPLHLGYLIFASLSSPQNISAAIAFLLPLLLYFIHSASIDARLRIAIDRLLAGEGRAVGKPKPGPNDEAKSVAQGASA